jgi:UDP-galactopyranose mutase
MPNVHFLGEKRPADVPRYVCSFDVGLLPYAINLETRHISPIKMYEYWAAGIPAIGTDIPSIQRNREAVTIAGDAGGFVARIGAVLEDFPDAEREKLIARAGTNAWSRRVEQVAHAIDTRLVRAATCSPGAAATGDLASPSWKGH